MSADGETLVLGQDDDGPRHYLAGRPVADGDALEMQTPYGWTPGRYSAIRRADTLGWPRLATGGADLLIRPESRLRWPGAAPA